MKSDMRNEIKAYIVRRGMTMQEVVDVLSDVYGWSDSVSNLSNKLQRESLRYKEAVQLADALGYDIQCKVYPMSRTNRNTDKKISKVKWDRALHRMMVCPAKDKRQTEGNGKTHLARALPAATDNDHCYNSRSNHQ